MVLLRLETFRYFEGTRSKYGENQHICREHYHCSQRFHVKKEGKRFL